MIEYEYELIRSRRRSLSVSISAENKITVRCPLNFSENRVVEFLELKKDWLDKVILKNNAKLQKNDDVINYRQIYVGGKKLPLIISDKNSVAADAVYVKNIKAVKKTYISAFGGGFLEIVKNLADGLNLPAKGFFIKSYKSRWGCCDRCGNLFFNWTLFMLPPEIQRYVIIHELSHLVYFNHSEKFWQLVANHEPNFKQLRKKLKTFDFLTRLY